jgi:hypothetical protein
VRVGDMNIRLMPRIPAAHADVQHLIVVHRRGRA